MSILSGFKKYKKYKKTNEGYQLQSQWTSGSSVEMADGNTAEKNLGAIHGITDSLTATNSNVALSAKSGKSLQDQITELNTGLDMVNSNFNIKGKLGIGSAQSQYVTVLNDFSYYNFNVAIYSLIINITDIPDGATIMTVAPELHDFYMTLIQPHNGKSYPLFVHNGDVKAWGIIPACNNCVIVGVYINA